MKRVTGIVLIGLMAFLFACSAEKEKDSQFKELKDFPAEPEPPAAPLQMNDLQVGTGDGAETGDTVLVHYTGWLYVDGARSTQFDTSRAADRGLFEVTIGETPVIRGWTQGLVGMKVGGIRQLIVPPELGYGPVGKPPRIPPSATLEFEIELHGIVKPK